MVFNDEGIRYKKSSSPFAHEGIRFLSKSWDPSWWNPFSTNWLNRKQYIETNRYKKNPFEGEGIRFKRSVFADDGIRYKKSPFNEEGIRFKKSPFNEEGIRFKKSPFNEEGIRFKKSPFDEEGNN